MQEQNNLATMSADEAAPLDDVLKLALFDQHRSLLLAVAYRMLGSVTDAEDMVQETFIRWQQAQAESILSPRAFLVTIVSRLCINHLQSARVQREQYFGQWLPEPWITEPSTEPVDAVQADETLSMAFLVLLERLNPVERAVFILREVFDYAYLEISELLGQSEANCRQILRRARKHVEAMRPRFSPSAAKRHALVERFVRATASGDLDGLIALLADDVVLYTDGGGKAAAVPNLIRGANNVARAIVLGGAKFRPKEGVVSRPVFVNGTPGILSYLWERPLSVFTLEAREELISAIYFVTNPEKLSHIPVLKVGPNEF